MNMVELTIRRTALQDDLKELERIAASEALTPMDRMQQARIEDQIRVTRTLVSVMSRRIKAATCEPEQMAVCLDPLPHVQRMMRDANELLWKLSAVNELLHSDRRVPLPDGDRILLAEQSKWMSGYLDVLNQRINRGLSSQ